MSKNVVVNVDYIKGTIPGDFALKENLVKDKEKMYLAIKELTALKQKINTALKKYDAENNLALDDVLNINHFLLNIRK